MGYDRILYFDCFSGISGDMAVGALLDLGVDREAFLGELGKVGAGSYRIEISEQRAGMFRATDFNVILDAPPAHGHRNLFDVERILTESGLREPVRERATRIFRLIAAAESAVHGRPVEQVFFHEVGAIDSIADIVGACVCVDLLAPDRIASSPPNLGTGIIEGAHGVLPVPAPATAELLKGVPVWSSGVRGELVTPTGAALLKGLADSFGPLPAMQIERIGYGRGKKEYGIPNVLRVFLGHTAD